MAAERAKAAAPAEEDEEEDDAPKGLLSGIATKPNPNHKKKQEKMIKIKDMNNVVVENPEAGLTRKEK